MNGFIAWLSARFVFRGSIVNMPTLLALLGLVIGVATLVLALSVVSGVETLLKEAVIDVTGHVMVMKPGGIINPQQTIVPEIQAKIKGFVAATPFVHLEAMAVSHGKTQGVMVQGVDSSTLDQVLSLKKRVIEGEFILSEIDGLDAAVIGKELANKFHLKPGSELQVVVPRPSKTDGSAFSPSMKSLRVSGIVDLGKYDFNDRVIIVSDLLAQDLAGIGNVYSGLRIRLKDASQSKEAGYQITELLGHPYWVKDWFDTNYNFFSAVEIEKVVIFLVLCLIVVIASFNVASLLLVNVLRRYQQISVLKALGAKQATLVKLFVFQGLVLGSIGSSVGVVVGIILSKIVSVRGLIDVPAEIYKFDHIPVEFRAYDILLILSVSFVLCLVSTLVPALKGARLNPIEGLKYE